jgi:hypothetical protein
MGRQKLFVDIKFNEFAYAVLSSLPPEKLALMNSSERAKVTGKGALTKFLNNATEEQVYVILAKAGVECHRVFHYAEKLDAKTIQRTYRQYSLKDQALKNVEEMLENQVFVTDSRELSISLSMMSLNCHSSAYQFNTAYARYAIRGKRFEEKNLAHQYAGFYAGQQHVRKLLLYGLMMDANAKRWQLITADLIILFLMAGFPNQYVTTNYLKRMTAHKYKGSFIDKRCALLFRDKQYLDKLPAKEKNRVSYRITSQGILVVGELINEAVNEKD